MEGGAGFEPAISHVLRVCLPKAPTAHFEGGAGLPRYAPAPGIVRTSAAGRTRTPLCHGSELPYLSMAPAPTPSGRGIFTRAVFPAVKRHCLPLCHRVLTLRGCRSFPAVIGRITYKAPLYRKRAAVVAGFRPLRQLFPLAEAVLGFLANLPKTERSVVL